MQTIDFLIGRELRITPGVDYTLHENNAQMTCKIRSRLLTEKTFTDVVLKADKFDGDGSNLEFDGTTPVLDVDGFDVFVSGSLVTTGVTKTVTSGGIPRATFGSAPAQGTKNVEIRVVVGLLVAEAELKDFATYMVVQSSDQNNRIYSVLLEGQANGNFVEFVHHTDFKLSTNLDPAILSSTKEQTGTSGGAKVS